MTGQIDSLITLTQFSNSVSVQSLLIFNLIQSLSFHYIQFVGPSCGHHASYTFYKAIKYTCAKTGRTKVLGLGEFFFVKVWSDSDLVSIGEIQLLWEDKNTSQVLSSLRLYYPPEYTPEGRLDGHGEVGQLLRVNQGFNVAV